MSYIDLSVPINEQTPVYPGDPATVIKPAGTVENDGFNDHYVSMGTHVGTHIDAPMHMIEGGASLDQMPLEQFIGRGILIDVTDGNFDKAWHADIQPGDIVLFYTGMGEKYYDPMYFEDYPAIKQDLADFLIEKKPKMIGLDTGTPDNEEGFPIHKALLGANILIIENLTNLAQLVGKQFKIYALPIKLQIDGAPARVIAEVAE